MVRTRRDGGARRDALGTDDSPPRAPPALLLPFWAELAPVLGLGRRDSAGLRAREAGRGSVGTGVKCTGAQGLSLEPPLLDLPWSVAIEGLFPNHQVDVAHTSGLSKGSVWTWGWWAVHGC